MGIRRTTTFAAIGALLLVLVAVDGRHALANSYVVAGPGSVVTGYATPAMVVRRGSKAFFTNLDAPAHDVVAKASGTYGGKKFRSKLISTGKTTVIQGVDQLKAGTYAFYCSLHPNMKGSLIVV